MKKLLTTIVVLLAVLGLSTPLNAETVVTFATQAEADTAFHTGNFGRYLPLARAKNPVEGEKRKTETAILAELYTTHGWRWVIYMPGEELIWQDDHPIGDSRCGNPIRTWTYPSPAPTPALPATTPTLVGLPTGDLVVDNRTFIDNSDHSTNIWVATPPIQTAWQKCWAGNFVHAGPCRWIVRGLLVLGGTALASGGKSSSKGPEVTTLPPN